MSVADKVREATQWATDQASSEETEGSHERICCRGPSSVQEMIPDRNIVRQATEQEVAASRGRSSEA